MGLKKLFRAVGPILVFPSLAASANIYYMATAKQNQRRSGAVSPTPARKAPTSKNQSLQKLYARLEKTRPGSEESKRISQQIVDAIGQLMAAVKIRPPRDARCRTYRDHLRDRVDKRQFLASMAVELDEWLKSNPEAPDLEEAPEGWHKFFDSFTICGEDECIKTLFTIYAPGKPRRGSVDLDRWEKQGHS